MVIRIHPLVDFVFHLGDPNKVYAIAFSLFNGFLFYEGSTAWILTKLNDSVWECNLINKLSKENKTRIESLCDFGSGYDCMWCGNQPHSSDCTGKTQSGGDRSVVW